jgi:hypothetical protein
MQDAIADNFDNTVSKLSLQKAYETRVNGILIRFLVQHNTVPNAFEIATRPHNCRECGRRFAFFSNLSGGGIPVFSSVSKFLSDAIELDSLAEKACLTPPKDILVIQPNDTYLRFKLHAGVSSMDGSPFCHYCFQIPTELRSESSETKGKNRIYDLFSSAVRRYLTSEADPIISRLIGKILLQGTKSLELLYKTLEEVPYGENTYASAVKWMLAIIEHHPKKDSSALDLFLFKINTISSAGVYQDAFGAVCPLIHSALHLMDILDEAGNMNDLKKTLSLRLDPTCYRRTEAPATDWQLKLAKERLGNFRARIMSVAEAQTMKGWFQIADREQKSTCAGDVLADMMKTKMKKSFADRVGESSIVEKIRFIKTLDGLKQFLLENPKAQVELNTLGSPDYHGYHAVMVDAEGNHTKFDFIRSDLEYLWSFGGLKIQKSGFIPISGILQTCVGRYNNIVFCLDNCFDNDVQISGGCFFPEFLATSCTRTCGKAFEDLQPSHKKIIQVPTQIPLAVGHATSIMNLKGELVHKVSLKIIVDSYSGVCTLEREK